MSALTTIDNPPLGRRKFDFLFRMMISPLTRQAFRYLQASIVGTLANFGSRFILAQWMSFGWSVIAANYIGMALVFLLSYKRAFGVRKVNWRMVGRFVVVAHIGLLTVWAVSVACLWGVRLVLPETGETLRILAENTTLLHELPPIILARLSSIIEGGCHAVGIICGFLVNFFGHKWFSFAGAILPDRVASPLCEKRNQL